MTEHAEDAPGPRPVRRPGRPSLLTRERVARAAFDLVDAEGVAALTIGRLAKELGVGPMTIYGYAESKDAIVSMLPDLLLEQLPPINLDQDWRGVLEQVFIDIYRRFLDHSNVVLAIADSAVFGSAQAGVIDQLLACLDEAGFSAEQAFDLQRTLTTYTLGFALFAIVENRAGRDRPRASWTHDLDESEFPHVARVSALFGAGIGEDQYRGGVRRILRGEIPDSAGSGGTHTD